MAVGDAPISAAIAARRSVRKFARLAVDGDTVERLVAVACTAPAPHHSRPWRFVHLASASARERLSDAMADAWRADLERARESVHTIDRLLKRSRSQVTEAPALLLACLTLDQARPWRDKPRRLAERDMFVQSLGAALQNLLLAAADYGLAGYLKGAPSSAPTPSARRSTCRRTGTPPSSSSSATQISGANNHPGRHWPQMTISPSVRPMKNEAGFAIRPEHSAYRPGDQVTALVSLRQRRPSTFRGGMVQLVCSGHYRGAYSKHHSGEAWVTHFKSEQIFMDPAQVGAEELLFEVDFKLPTDVLLPTRAT